MKVVVAVVLLVAHLAAGFSNCPKRRYNFLDVAKYNDERIETYSFLSVPRDQVSFRLWTRDHDKVFAPLYYGHLRDEPSIRPDKQFKVIIHGWSDCADTEWYAMFKEALLKTDDYNVIQVDWKKPASALYPVSARHTKDVGKYVGELLVDLNQTLGVPFENIHLIGHSLGAHISGFAGKIVQKTTKKMVGRITGLDPAGPLFLLAIPVNRLYRGDALYTDIIHTDGGKLGYLNVLGHADFYPNGGHSPQPGCMVKGIVEVASCSHNRSYYFYIESISSNNFIAHECPSYKAYKTGKCKSNPTAVMGENIPTGTKGVFYLKTNADSPYAKPENV